MSVRIESEQSLIEKVTENCLIKLKEEKDENNQKQLNQINNLLEHWSEQLLQKTKDIVNDLKLNQSSQSSLQHSSSSNVNDYNNYNIVTTEQLNNTITDIKDRHSNLVLAIQEAHSKQLEVLRAAIGEERKQFAQAQMIFEQTLKTRYECMVDTLHDKVKAEQEARMQRALDNLERSARIESERAKQSFEIQQEAELTLSQKFKSIVSDLRKSWEEEETGRAMQLEERLRSHYSVVLEHMEAQLKMALKLQDDADKQWLNDVESRNNQQIQTLKAFEDKCRRLYDIRLNEYAEKTNQQIAQYEEQLLEAGTILASEKAQFESRLRRIKLGCSRWKIAYQKEIHDRYQEMTNVLEERYMSEVAQRLQEINNIKMTLNEVQLSLYKKEQEILKVHKMYSPGGLDGTAPTTTGIRDDLNQRWNDLKIPYQDRLDSLVSILDSAQVNPVMIGRYEAVVEKLSSRQPIAQVKKLMVMMMIVMMVIMMIVMMVIKMMMMIMMVIKDDDDDDKRL